MARARRNANLKKTHTKVDAIYRFQITTGIEKKKYLEKKCKPGFEKTSSDCLLKNIVRFIHLYTLYIVR